MVLARAAIGFLCVTLLLASASGAEITLQRKGQNVVVLAGGRPFTEYYAKSGVKPILWPLIGPNGKPVTRNYPMKTVPGEDQDHIHQRSFWFTHGKVNGTDFWSEMPGHGTIEHREYRKVQSGPEAVIVTRNDWLDAKGHKQCEDERTLTFHADEAGRSIDFDVIVKATDGPVVFGDTKEGAFGIRLATPLTVESRAKVKLGGHIVNSSGLIDDKAWGKTAQWVDCYGSDSDKKHYGVAIMNHPASFRYPTPWHVRPYGLFAANPFGIHDFNLGSDGTYTLAAGDTLALHYRVFLHNGDAKEGKVADAFARYSHVTK